MTPDKFRHYRLLLKLSQVELGQRLHCDRMTILRYENGKTKIPYTVELFLMQLLKDEGVRDE